MANRPPDDTLETRGTSAVEMCWTSQKCGSPGQGRLARARDVSGVCRDYPDAGKLPRVWLLNGEDSPLVGKRRYSHTTHQEPLVLTAWQ
jgi:hypothetical protein